MTRSLARLAIALACGCGLASEPWRANPPTTDEQFFVMLPRLHADRLPSGLAVMTSRSAENGLAHVAVVMRGGYERDPPGKEGLARLAAALLLRWAGTPDNDARFGRLGAQPHVSVTRAGLLVSVDVLPEEAPEATALLAGLVAGASSSVAGFETAKAEALSELDGTRGTANSLAAFAMGRIFALAKDRVANLGFGSPTTVSAITPADVEQYFLAACNAREAALVATGNVERDGPKQWASTAFSAWPSAPPRTAVQARRVVPRTGSVFVPVQGMEQTLIVVGGWRPHPSEPDAVAFDAALGLLSARLQGALREVLRVSYGQQPILSEDDTFMVAFRVRADATRAAVREIDAAVDATVEQLPPQWLHLRRLSLSGGMMLDAQDAARVAKHASEVFLFGRETDALQRSLAALQELGSEEVERSAADHLAVDRVRIVVVGDPDLIGGQLGHRFSEWSVEEVFAPAG